MSAFLTDGVVSLRPIQRADLPQLAAWRNDPELRQRTREWRPLTDADQEAWYQGISGRARRDLMFVVEYVRVSGSDLLGRAELSRHSIGVVGLCGWDAIDATAEISFYVGDESARGKGYTKAALRLLIAWGFQSMRLDRIWAEAYDFNAPSHAVLRSLGFIEEGRLRSHVWKNGQRCDSLMFGLLKGEWHG